MPTFRLRNEIKTIEISAEKACRVNRPSPKLQRQIGIRREICRIVPVSNPQACCAKACGSWAFLRSRKWRREFGPEATGAGERIRILGLKLDQIVPTARDKWRTV